MAGSPGDAATARYIAARLRAAGFRVSEQTFKVPLYLELARPRVSGLRRSQIVTMGFSGSGRASGRIREVGLGCSRGSTTRRCGAARSRWRGAGSARSPRAPGSPSAPAPARCW